MDYREAKLRVDPDAADLVVSGLGKTRVWVRGHEVETWGSQRGATILRYLVMHRTEPVPKESLTDLLWPHATPRSARNNLNVAIYGLRRALEASGGDRTFVVYRDGTYALARDLTIAADLDAFERAIARADAAWEADAITDARWDYEGAVSLCSGPLFSDDTTPVWLDGHRLRAEDQLVRALERIATHCLATGDLAACMEAAERALELQPCRESVHRLMMEAHAAQGQPQLVARQYTTCVNALSQTYSVPPQPETTGLFHRLMGV